MRDGRLEAIFRRWEMWNEDQPRLYARVLAGESVELLRTAGAGSTDTWAAARRYFPALLRAAVITLILSCAAMALAVVIGSLIATGRVYGPRPLQAVLTAYVEVIRGTPLLLQLFVLYFGLAPFVQLPAFVAALHRPGPQLRGLRERDLSRRACRRFRRDSSMRRARSGFPTARR